jgi:hypothetical protein
MAESEGKSHRDSRNHMVDTYFESSIVNAILSYFSGYRKRPTLIALLFT